MTAGDEQTADTVPVEVLTDEELAVLSAPGGIVVMPFLDGIPDHQRDVALRTAYRGLLARGIVDPPTPQATAAAVARGDGHVELMVRQDVRSLVALREAARAVVAVARTTAAAQDFWYAHVVDDVVLLEEVGSDGMHRFALAHAHQLADLTVEASVRGDSGDAHGEPVELVSETGDPTPPEEILEQLGAATLRSDVIVRWVGDHDPAMVGVFSGPGGTWWTRVQHGSGQAPTAVPSSAREVRDMVRDLIEDAFAQVTIRGL